MSSNDQPPTGTAFAGIAVVIAHLGSLVLGIYAIAYIIGYNYLFAYFSTVKAPWVLEYFTSEQIARQGSYIASVIVIAVLYALILLMNGASSRTLDKWSTWLLALGGLAMLIAMIDFSSLSATTTASITKYAGITCAISGSLKLGELIWRLRDSSSQWNAYHLIAIQAFYVLALVQAPSIYGSAIAEIDMSVDGSSLPYISEEGDAAYDWRLVRLLGDKLLIVTTTSEDMFARTFKLVSVDKSWQIYQKQP